MKFRNMTISFAVLTLVGCKNVFEDNDVTLDGSTPYSEIDFPRKNNTYSTDKPFRVGVGFSDKDAVEEIDVKIIRLGNDLRETSNVVDFKRYPNATICSVDTTFAPKTFSAGDYRLIIRSMDTRKNAGTQEVNFTVKN